MFRLCLATALLLTTGAAAAGPDQRDRREEAKLAKALRGLTPGRAQTCLRREQFNEIRTFPNTILYVAGRNKVWRNDVVGTCTGLARRDIPVIRTRGGRYCDGDLVQTRAPTGGMLTGSCSLGKFVPYSK